MAKEIAKRRSYGATATHILNNSDEEEESVVTHAGYSINTSGLLWHIPHPSRPLYLRWDEIPIFLRSAWNATRAYFRHLIRNYSTSEVMGNWYALMRAWLCPSLQRAIESGDEIPYRFFDELQGVFSNEDTYRLHYVRKWYSWCCDQGFEAFSSEVAFRLEERVVGGNRKGHAVRSADPEKGPLLDTEIVALNNALRASRETGTLSLEEQVALWLCIGLGSNAGPLALLREEDFGLMMAPRVEGAVYKLAVPRHKKGDAEPRTQFRERKLNPEVGELVEALIEQNRSAFPIREGDSDGRPLFRRANERTDLPPEGRGSDYRYHHSAVELGQLVTAAVKRLGVISSRTGCDLKVSVRRLRYTLATRLVREGASQRVLAHLLDHSDLQNVQVYFEIGSDIVEHLDAAMALELGPLSQAFLGTLVRTESDALRGDRPSSRIYNFDRGADRLDALGTCGSFSFCGLTAPIACYTCVRFQPWMDAPHDKALSAMLSERQRRQDARQDPGMVTLFDLTILAIADVIRRIDTVRQGQSNAA